jgi:cytochrome c oxidase subunit 3
VILGIMFTSLQAYEYMHAGFGFANHIYGSTFLHGDRLPRLPCDRRHHIPHRVPDQGRCAGAFTPKLHFGFEAAAWYWHFVDVVWLFLFTCIYVWGGGTDFPAH